MSPVYHDHFEACAVCEGGCPAGSVYDLVDHFFCQLADFKAVGADAVYAWPKAYIAPINAEAAVRILEKEEIRAGKPVAELAKFYEENNGALAAAEEGLCDDVIEPAATRQMIAAALEMLMGKREVALPRKHGTLPL